MSDDLAAILGGDAPKPAKPRAVTALPPGADPVILTILGEAGGNAEGQRAVASTIMNRARRTGETPAEVVASRAHGYEAWQGDRDATIRRYPVGSKAYAEALANVGPIVSGEVPTPYAYTHFYSPSGQSARGRKPPAWDNGSGIDIGGNLFFANVDSPATGDADLDALLAPETGGVDADAAFERAFTAEGKKPGSGAVYDRVTGLPVTAAQEATYQRLAKAGKLIATAEPGTEGLPYRIQPGGKLPTARGAYFVDLDGQTRRVDPGNPVENLLTGAARGVEDVASGINKLTGGGFVTPAMEGGLPVAAMRDPGFDAAMREGVNRLLESRRQAYEGEFGLLPEAATGRFVGQTAVTAPAMAGTTVALRAAGPVGEFLAGTGGGNLLMRTASRGAGGAVQGALGGGMVSGASDAPVAEQVGVGALTGGALTGGIPLLADATVGGLRNALLPDIDPRISALARAAIDDYGIPLRTSQIRGAAGDRSAAVRDSELIGKMGTGFAANLAEQRRAFTKAVAQTFGEDADALTPEVMQRARDRIGGDIERVGRAVTIGDTDPLQTRLGDIIRDAQMSLPDSEVAPLLRQVQNIGDTIQNRTMSGETYLALIRKGSPLDNAQSNKDASIRYYAGQIREALDDAVEAFATPEDIEALRRARFEYKNLMTIKDIAAKAGVTGEISPLLLQGAVNRSFRDRAFRGAGDLGELSDIAQAFMREPPNSGTPSRLRDMLRGTILGGAGVGEIALLMHDPSLAAQAALGAGFLGAGQLGRNALSGVLNNNSIATNLLLRTPGVQSPVLAQLAAAERAARPAYVPVSILGGTQVVNSLLAPRPDGQLQYAP